MKIVNIRQLWSVIVVLLTVVVGIYWFGYQVHSWQSYKNIFDLSEQNSNQEKTIKDLQGELETLKKSVIKGSNINWEGTWETETPVFKNVRISFIQSGNKVEGKYKFISKDNREFLGYIEAEVTDNVLVGSWNEFNGKSKIWGLVYFVISQDGHSFLGKYTRNWEGNQSNHVWSGKRVK